MSGLVRIRRAWGWNVFLGLALVAFAVPTIATAQEEEPELKWQQGPMVGRLGNVATIQVPEDFLFLDALETRRFMELLGNPTNGTELGTLAPTINDDGWFVVFEYDDTGYVKDDDKHSINPDALLRSLRQGNEAANAQRRKNGWSTLNIVGWEYPPSYDETTKNLQWAIRAEGEDGHPIVNFNTRILGRGGVMSVTLVASPEALAKTVPIFKTQLAGFSYVPGLTYAEWRPGDRVAQIGLAALVTGGGAAVAAKTGLLAKLFAMLAKLGKGLIVLVVAGAAAVKVFLSKLFGRRTEA